MLEDYVLRQSQKNEVLEVLKEVGLEAHLSRFEWIVEDLGFSTNSKLVFRFKNRNYYFCFRYSDRSNRPSQSPSWTIKYSPGDNIVGSSARSQVNNWERTFFSLFPRGVLNYVRNWGENLAREINTPDLWEQIHSQKAFIGFDVSGTDEFTHFTVNQKEIIRSALIVAEHSVKEQIRLSQSDMEFIRERFEYLSEALDRLNRFDWKGLLTGTLISISVNLAFDTQTGRLLYEVVKQAFSQTLLLLP